jgi:hypothetical protein
MGCLSRQISIPADRDPKARQVQHSNCGALGEIRTPDPQIRSLMLYPAELRARQAHHNGFAAKVTSLQRKIIRFRPPGTPGPRRPACPLCRNGGACSFVNRSGRMEDGDIQCLTIAIWIPTIATRRIRTGATLNWTLTRVPPMRCGVGWWVPCLCLLFWRSYSAPVINRPERIPLRTT